MYMHTTEPGRLTPWALVPDWTMNQQRDCVQHILFNGGVGSDCAAACLKSLVYDNVFGDSSDLDSCMTEMHHQFVESNCLTVTAEGAECKAFTTGRLGMTARERQPSFGLSYKHSHIRAFCHFAATICLLHQDTQFKRLRYLCISSLSIFISHAECCGLMLTSPQRQYLNSVGQRFLDTYSLLIADDRRRRPLPNYIALFRARPKVHALWHHVQHLLSSRMNVVTIFSCWAEEDLMGRVVRISRRTHPATVARRTLQRWVLYLHAELIQPA
jgi:hypothetical protein